jgi:hypothetical protein
MSVRRSGAPERARYVSVGALVAAVALSLSLESGCSNKHSARVESRADAGSETAPAGSDATEGGSGRGGAGARAPQTGTAGSGRSSGGAPGPGTPEGTKARYPLKLGPVGARYLLDQQGHPFFWAGEAAWSLIAQLSLEDARVYLDDRQRKSVNLLMVNLIEHKFAANAPANRAGDRPFGAKPFTAFNEAYFAHADAVLREAAARDMVVLLAPTYLGYDCGDEGFCQDIARTSAAEMRAWGRYLGDRYASFPNLIWLIGGDADPTPVQSKLREVVDGIRERDSAHLMSAHDAPESLASSHWQSASWLTVNNIYTYDPATYAWADKARQSGKPFYLAESTYENEHDASPQSLRAQAYYAVLGGSMGHIFGNCPMWHFDSSNDFCDQRGWRSQLDSPGSQSMQHLRKLFSSRAWQDLMPDTDHSTLTGGFGKSGEGDYAAGALTVDRSSFIAYLPSARQITVDLTRLSGAEIRVTWFDPSQGTAQALSSLTGQQTVSLSPPRAGDWVLILDDSARGFAAPGSD